MCVLGNAQSYSERHNHCTGLDTTWASSICYGCFRSQTAVGCLDMAWDLWRTGWHSDTVRFGVGSWAFSLSHIIPPMLLFICASGGCTNDPLEATTLDGSLASPPAKNNKTIIIIINNNNFIYLAGCTTFLYLPAPI